MKNLNVKNRIGAIEYILKMMDKDESEFEPQLTYFLLVAIYGAAQYSIKTLLVDWMNPDLSSENLKKLEEKINGLIQTPSVTNIRDLLLIVKKEIDIGKYGKYNSLIRQRHYFAHGETDPTKLEGVTLKEVKGSFEELKVLLDEVEDLLE